jgi:outer membrane protease
MRGLILTMTALLLATPFSRASGAGLDISLGPGWMTGETSYSIGGRLDSPMGSGEIHFPLSELKFPLDVTMITFTADLEITDRWSLEGRLSKNVTEDAGTVENSDWTMPAAPGLLTVFSESDGELSAVMADFRLRYRFLRGPNWSFLAGAGFTYQKLDYDIRNVDQWYPPFPELGHIMVPGKAATYQVTYNIPYAEVAAEAVFGDRLHLESRLGYSPFTSAEDEDDHILRSKFSRGDTDGNTLLISVEGRYDFWRNLFLSLRLDYLKIDTEGRQTQTRYAATEEGPPGPIGTIDQNIDSSQTAITLALGLFF